MNEEMFHKWKTDSKWFFDWIGDRIEALDEDVKNNAVQVLVCPIEEMDQMRLQTAGIAGQLSAFEEMFEVKREEIFDE